MFAQERPDRVPFDQIHPRRPDDQRAFGIGPCMDGIADLKQKRIELPVPGGIMSRYPV